jgi:RNA polymerase sigma-70 factor (ECF subfamily)
MVKFFGEISGESASSGSLERELPTPNELRQIETSSDARLVERARLGDDDAFGLLVARYERKLIRVIARLVRHEELARDLAQDTFWKVYQRLDQFDTARRFGPWLFRVGVNLALDALRRVRPQMSSVDRFNDGRNGLSEVSICDPRDREDLIQEIRHVLDRLPLEFRTVLVLRDLEGFSSPEVAAIVNRREATVRWRLAKARELFRQQWARRQTELPASRQEARS